MREETDLAIKIKRAQRIALDALPKTTAKADHHHTTHNIPTHNPQTIPSSTLHQQQQRRAASSATAAKPDELIALSAAPADAATLPAAKPAANPAAATAAPNAFAKLMAKKPAAALHVGEPAGELDAEQAGASSHRVRSSTAASSTIDVTSPDERPTATASSPIDVSSPSAATSAEVTPPTDAATLADALSSRGCDKEPSIRARTAGRGRSRGRGRGRGGRGAGRKRARRTEGSSDDGDDAETSSDDDQSATFFLPRSERLAKQQAEKKEKEAKRVAEAAQREAERAEKETIRAALEKAQAGSELVAAIDASAAAPTPIDLSESQFSLDELESAVVVASERVTAVADLLTGLRKALKRAAAAHVDDELRQRGKARLDALVNEYDSVDKARTHAEMRAKREEARLRCLDDTKRVRAELAQVNANKSTSFFFDAAARQKAAAEAAVQICESTAPEDGGRNGCWDVDDDLDATPQREGGSGPATAPGWFEDWEWGAPLVAMHIPAAVSVDLAGALARRPRLAPALPSDSLGVPLMTLLPQTPPLRRVATETVASLSEACLGRWPDVLRGDGHAEAANGALWCEAFKPTTATALCGNAPAAAAIRDWLRNWAATKPAGRAQRHLSGGSSSGSDDSDFAESETTRRGGHDSGGLAALDAGSRMLLLEGPSGSGKSAAIYAIAKELNLRVIEVNPAERRSAKLMLAKFGEATQSREIRLAGGAEAPARGVVKPYAKAPVGIGAKPNAKASKSAAFAAFFGGAAKKAKSAPAVVNILSDAESDGAAAAQFVSPAVSAATPAAASPAVAIDHAAAPESKGDQMLLLFEEVDIVFEDDIDFHKALLQLCRTSKCPIIGTCNVKPAQLVQIANVVPVVPWHRPTQPGLVEYVNAVGASCGVAFKQTHLHHLVAHLAGDLRRILNELQCAALVPAASGAAEVGVERVLGLGNVCAGASASQVLLRGIANAGEGRSLRLATEVLAHLAGVGAPNPLMLNPLRTLDAALHGALLGAQAGCTLDGALGEEILQVGPESGLEGLEATLFRVAAPSGPADDAPASSSQPPQSGGCRGLELLKGRKRLRRATTDECELPVDFGGDDETAMDTASSAAPADLPICAAERVPTATVAHEAAHGGGEAAPAADTGGAEGASQTVPRAFCASDQAEVGVIEAAAQLMEELSFAHVLSDETHRTLYAHTEGLLAPTSKGLSDICATLQLMSAGCCYERLRATAGPYGGRATRCGDDEAYEVDSSLLAMPPGEEVALEHCTKYAKSVEFIYPLLGACGAGPPRQRDSEQEYMGALRRIHRLEHVRRGSQAKRRFTHHLVRSGLSASTVEVIASVHTPDSVGAFE